MIRRNTADQVIYFPQLVLAADGAAVAASATLTVAKDGSEAASGGTLAHVANGVWKYTPTQAETDAAIVALILTATGAVPVVLNLVTTAADTQAVALGANTVTPTNLSAAQVRTELATELGRIDATISSRLSTLGTNAPANWINAAALTDGAITSAKIADNAIAAAKIASNAITDAKIASNAFTAAKFATASLNGKGDWNVGKTGYSLSQAFPSNFAALGINASGHVSRVVLVDTTTANSDMRGTDGAYTGTPPTVSAIQDGLATQAELDKVIKTGEARTISRTGKDPITLTETRG